MRMPRAITAASLITATQIHPRPLIFLADGKVERLTTQGRHPAPDGTLHLPNCTLSEGMLDLHAHGAGGRDLMDAAPDSLAIVSRMLAKRGTAEYLATTITAPVDTTLAALERLANAIEAEPTAEAATPIGIHLEGPFLSHKKRGVHPEADLQPASIDLFERLWQAARGHVRMLTIAPELPGALDLIRHATSRGIRITLGHTDARTSEARDGIAAGAVSATHTFNAMRALDHRDPGILGVVLDTAHLFADLICDGIHVAPEAVRLWWRMKGPERAILISDGMAATGMPDGHYRLGELDVEVKDGACMHDGVLAGSVLTLDRAVQNLRDFTGADLPTAVRAATRNPAALLFGEGARPPLTASSDANLCIWGKSGKLAGTVVRGALLA